ncbi:MAG: alpha/beta hydrolase [Burkholderiaceae bacterium]|jgi:pimeloyl-ACP methyl ester carboxylesterase|nr:alpha/beta hydrolase [Burkholderiaceae bacterium]
MSSSIIIDGIETRYEVRGSGAPLLMYSPGGFDATLEKWSTLGVYGKTKMLGPLTEHFQCILFDRRETGASGGRVERITWQHFVTQGKGLLEHLGHRRAHLMGGCMGCSPVVAFAAQYPEMVRSMVLYWPVGGARYRIAAQQRFTQHLAYAQQEGLAGVLALARSGTKSFGEDPRAGPWVSVLRRDSAFAESYVKQDLERYKLAVLGTMRALFDRDTAPGAEAEEMLRMDIPALVVPGQDASHATSAARYFQECLPGSEYWDMAPVDQAEANVPPRLLDFLARH